VASPPPFFEETQAVEQLEEKARSAPETRAEVITELMKMVGDATQIPEVRMAAAEALGNLKATEAKGMLNSLASSLDMKLEENRLLHSPIAAAYWKIIVAEQPDEAAQEELLMALLSPHALPPQSPLVWSWAIDELANRGVERALPRMLECIDRRLGENKQAEYEKWLCETKVKLLASNSERRIALEKALVTPRSRSVSEAEVLGD
jgi:hypothetical protein